jgi:hypothetical protein
MALWVERNQYFDDVGYCFSTDLGQAYFGTANCRARSPNLNANTQARVNWIRQREANLGCSAQQPGWTAASIRNSLTPNAATATAPTVTVDVRGAQAALNALGYNAGVADGVMGNRTRAAIQVWQRDRGYPATGQLTPSERASLISKEERPQATVSADAGSPSVAQTQSEAVAPASEADLVMATLLEDDLWCSEHVAVTIGYDQAQYPQGRYGDASGLFPETAEPRKLVFVPPVTSYLRSLAAECQDMRSVDILFQLKGGDRFSDQTIRSTQFSDYTIAGREASLLSNLVGLVDEPITRCDELGGLSRDPDLPVGVEGLSVYGDQWNPSAAFDACIAAISEFGEERRFLVQAGRAMLYLGMFDGAFVYFEKAHELGSSTATNLLGTAYAEGWGVNEDLRTANLLWRESNRLGTFFDTGMGQDVARANGLQRMDTSLAGMAIARQEAADAALLSFIVGLNMATAPSDASLEVCNRGAYMLRLAYISAVPLPTTPTVASGYNLLPQGECRTTSNLDHRTVIAVVAQRPLTNGDWVNVDYDTPDGQLPHRFEYICAPQDGTSFVRTVSDLVMANPCLEGDVQLIPSFQIRIGSTNYTLDLG